MTTARRWRGRVFVGVSLDGYLARRDSDLGWLTDPPPGIDHARITSAPPALDYDTFIADVDHLVMGRGTYDKVLTFGQWPYDGRQVVVLSTSLPRDADPRVTVASGVDEAVRVLDARGAREVYVDGGRVVQAFLRAGLVDELTVSHAPVLLGDGISLFGSLPGDVRLRLRGAHAGDGMTHATYDVVR
jgi:dihydrofolate reductase